MKFIKNIDTKKALLTLFVVLLTGYVLWDISIRIISNFRMQGYEIAVMEMARQAKNEECQPFEIFVGEERIGLINIDCLQTQEGMPMDEGMMFEEEEITEELE